MRSLGAAQGLLATAACVLAGLGTGVFVADAASSAKQAAVAACTARQLTAQVESSSGAAGTVVLRVVFHNRDAACTLDGYPNLRLRRGARTLPTRTVRGALGILGKVVGPVKVATGGRAFLLVAYSYTPAGKGGRADSKAISSCPEASGVDVWVKGWKRPVKVDALIAACDGGLLRVTPFLSPS